MIRFLAEGQEIRDAETVHVRFGDDDVDIICRDELGRIQQIEIRKLHHKIQTGVFGGIEVFRKVPIE